IHYSSHKKLKPYIKVNCAILSGNLLESELFGHEKGAFSGAINEKKGRFELADGGTIFLDDVDDIPLDLQVKLLRILQDKKFEKVGATTTTQVDVRVIAASKFDLLEKVKKGEFRADLFYRLNVVPITLPPLRKKKEDIPFLIEAFIQKYSERPLEVTKRAMGYLLNYDWPGNVRELENLVERLALTVSNGKIDFNGLPKEILLNEIGIKQTDLNDNSFEQVIQETEISIIKNALVQTVGNKAKAARLLKLKPSTFRSKVEKYKI
ncbi:MAG: sigma 54-interacting transcriptional regulator, partial [Candidatus Aminicenantes bacterium]|nr:sigma 54-interacting transcriptional regulator [Candidatus Aminicenantes bacterium]